MCTVVLIYSLISGLIITQEDAKLSSMLALLPDCAAP